MIEFEVDLGYLTDYGEADPPDVVVLHDKNGEFPSVEYVRKEGSDD